MQIYSRTFKQQFKWFVEYIRECRSNVFLGLCPKHIDVGGEES